MSTNGGKCGASPTRVICAVGTLFKTGKLNDVDPYAWLAQALERIAAIGSVPVRVSHVHTRIPSTVRL